MKREKYKERQKERKEKYFHPYLSILQYTRIEDGNKSAMHA